MPARFPSPRTVAVLKWSRIRWAFVAAVPLLGVLWLSGCENTLEYARYPASLVYPLRTDLIVAKKPPNEVFSSPEPGRLDEEIAQVAKSGGETEDPNGVAADQRKMIEAALKTEFGTPRQPARRQGQGNGRRPRSTAVAAQGARRRRQGALSDARPGQ